MIIDDRADTKTKRQRPLYDMSVPELQEYIQELQDEIIRVKEDIKKKEAHRSGLDALFSDKK